MTLKRYYVFKQFTGAATEYKQYQIRPGTIIKSVSASFYSEAVLTWFNFCVWDGTYTTDSAAGTWKDMVWGWSGKIATDIGRHDSHKAEGGLDIPILSGTLSLTMRVGAALNDSFLSVVIDEPETWNPSLKSSRGL